MQVGGLIVLIVLLQMAGSRTALALRLDAAALSQGQVWRLVTAHLVHLGWAHTLLNVAGVLLCCALSPAVLDRWLFVRLGGLALGVSLCLWRFSPEVLPYVGLSGVLYGLFVWGLLPRALRRDGQAVAALAVVTTWMLWPFLFGSPQAEEALIGGAVIGIAHLYGYGLALIAVAIPECMRK